MVQWERVYCDVDDFCREFLPAWERQLLEAGASQRQRPAALTVSEVMTIVIAFQLSGYRTFKHFYIDCVGRYHRDAFPRLVSYSRFVELMPSVLVPLCALSRNPLWAGDRHRLHRFDPLGSLSPQARPCPSGV